MRENRKEKIRNSMIGTEKNQILHHFFFFFLLRPSYLFTPMRFVLSVLGKAAQ
jgi:hypothetical protein